MAVNYGKNVGSVRPNLIRWGRERDRSRSHPNPRAAPISFSTHNYDPRRLYQVVLAGPDEWRPQWFERLMLLV